jgi:hypothetical protein
MIMSPYGKSTSSNLKLLSPKHGLRYHSGCFRLVFGSSVVFYCYCGLTVLYLTKKHERGNNNKSSLTTVGAPSPTGPAGGREKR